MPDFLSEFFDTRFMPHGRHRAHFEAAEALVSGAVGTIRRLTIDLSPVVLQGAGLDEALRWLAVYMETRFGPACPLRRTGRSQSPRRTCACSCPVGPGSPVQRGAVRGDGPGVRHARRGRRRPHPRVTDAGNGFDAQDVLRRPPAPVGGLGLRNAPERLALFGGRLDVESAPGPGTRVTITIPVHTLRPSGPSA